MKYMHMNSSCPYAGLANMLMLLGRDTEDYKIALDMDLASHIRYDEETGVFRSGFSLQEKEWFDLYLKPRGYSYRETCWDKEEVLKNLRPGMMLGIFVEPERKRAVVCDAVEEGALTFLNNKWEQTEEAERLNFTPAELLERLPEQVTVGYIEPAKAETVDLRPVYAESLLTWKLLREKLRIFMEQTQTAKAMRGQLNVLFRALLLDGLTMAQLRKDEVLTEKLTALQGQFLGVLRQNIPARLADTVDMALLEEAVDLICQHAEAACQKCCPTETT